MLKICGKHGETDHALTIDRGSERYRCRKCLNERVSKHRNDKKHWAVALLGGECMRCGYDKYIGAIEFHHRNPSEKEFELSTYGKASYEKLAEELTKCDLLCSNCHKEVHAGM